MEQEKCKENMGFLTLRRCDNESAGKCGYCGKPVCAAHSQQTPSGLVCISCVRQRGDLAAQQPGQQGQQQAQQPGQQGQQPGQKPVPANSGVDPSRSMMAGYPYGHSYYNDYDYHPYSVHDRFDERDYAAIGAGAAAGAYEAGFEGS